MSLYDTADFESFWIEYERMHSRRATRWLHALATLTAIGMCIAAVVTGRWWLILLAPLIDRVISQLSHRLVEGNRTQPMRRPIWHLRAELRMCWRTLTLR